MFRYYFSTWRGNSLNWRESDATSVKAVIEEHYEKHMRKWDAENCGSREGFIAVRSPDGTVNYFKFLHEWWESNNDGEFSLENIFDVVPASKDEVGDTIPDDRDWLMLPNWSFGARRTG